MAAQSRATDDRRRGERHSINPEFAALEPGTLTYVSNLSEYGVFIHTRVRLPVGAAIDLRFTVLLDDPVVIHGPGRVVHHQDEPRGMGVVFVKLSAEMQLRVIDAIAWYRARAASAESGDRAFRTRELTPDELAQIDEEGDDEGDDDGNDPAAESVTSLSSSDMVAESGDHFAYLNASIEELRPEDIEAATSAHAASMRRSAPKTPPAAAPTPAAPAPPPPKPAPPPLKDDEYEDF